MSNFFSEFFRKLKNPPKNQLFSKKCRNLYIYGRNYWFFSGKTWKAILKNNFFRPKFSNSKKKKFFFKKNQYFPKFQQNLSISGTAKVYNINDPTDHITLKCTILIEDPVAERAEKPEVVAPTRDEQTQTEREKLRKVVEKGVQVWF